MDDFRIEFDGNALLEARRRLSRIPGGVETAAARAVNRALTGARTEITRAVRERYTIRARDVRQSLSIKRAAKGRLEGEIISRGYKIDLNASHFKVKPRADTTGNRQRHVTAEIIKGSPQTVERGFIFNTQVFRRVGRSRLPIAKQTGPAVPQMLEQDEVLQKTSQALQERFVSRLDHEVKAILNNWSKY